MEEQHYVNFSLEKISSISEVTFLDGLMCLQLSVKWEVRPEKMGYTLLTVAPQLLWVGQDTEVLPVKDLSCIEILMYLTCADHYNISTLSHRRIKFSQGGSPCRLGLKKSFFKLWQQEKFSVLGLGLSNCADSGSLLRKERLLWTPSTITKQ